ncbi:MAG: alpha/beta hydrolase [Patescibacteria group bacterium]|nr:alpha/beta hydrolase [Patescibacteria group bacterium]
MFVEGFSDQKGRLEIRKLEKESKGLMSVIEYVDHVDKSTLERLTKTEQGIEEYAKRVQKKLESLIKKEPITIIGHSMGGLIIRYLIEVKKIDLPPKSKIILVGVPNKGIKMNLFERLFFKIVKTPCVLDMLPNSVFLKKLSDPPKRYFFVAGKRDKRVLLSSSLPQGGKILNVDHRDLPLKVIKSILKT